MSKAHWTIIRMQEKTACTLGVTRMPPGKYFQKV